MGELSIVPNTTEEVFPIRNFLMIGKAHITININSAPQIEFIY